MFRVDIAFDRWPQEIRWELLDVRTSKIIVESGPYPANEFSYDTASASHAVCPSECLEFIIHDSFGDGLSDDGVSPGSYDLFYNDEHVREAGGNFESKQSSIFGIGCASSAPSLSKSPSVSPAPSIPICTTSATCTGVLTFFGSNPQCILPECAGHCDTDADCATDLVCYQRNPNEANENDSVPGCESVPYGTTSYCIAQELNPSIAPSHPITMEPSTLPTLTILPTLTPTMALTDRRTCPNWEQLGGSIDTKYTNFAMSSDGYVVAVREEESVHVYRLDDSSMQWNLQAEIIDPSFTSSADWLTFNIALSSDGSVVAISDSKYDQGRGRVNIFALHPDNGWTKLGAAINGENIGDGAGQGWSTVLSADGTAIAVGSTKYDNNTGHVRIFAYNIETQGWVQRGDTIRGEAIGDQSGYSVAFSRDASVVGIGALYNNGNGNNSGHVRVFGFDVQGSNWVQQGSDIDGEADGDISGYKIDLSADGSVVAVGAYANDGNGSESGHVRVFKYESTTGDWIKRGDDIDGESAGDHSGQAAMSADSTTIAIGANNNENKKGHFRVYDFDSTDQLWVQRGKDVDGEAANDDFGIAVSISADGSIIGANGSKTNSLRIFQWTLCSSPPTSMPTSTPDCPDGKTPLRLDLTTNRFPQQTTWQVDNLQSETVISGGPYDKLFSDYQENHCLDNGACHQFTIQDSASDGICCDWFSGDGTYALYIDSILIKEGGNFTGEVSSILFGNTCPSPIPSMGATSKPSTQPSQSMQPSNSPTHEPSNSPSYSPTAICPAGTFTNSTSRKCQVCPPGTFQDKPTYKEQCSNCEAGKYQPNEGQTKCMTCNRGKFQPQQGQVKCDQCRAGGYCPSDNTGACDGGFIPCPIGTHNNETGQGNASACLLCPPGTFADNNIGLVQCPQCPFRLSSQGGPRSACTFCDIGFFFEQ